MGSKYSQLKLTISLLEFLKYELTELLERLKERVAQLFPPILVLMNINGCLVHRTPDRINFIKPKEKEGMDERFDRYVLCLKHKVNNHYFRDGFMSFLRALMTHPRVRFAFYSNIARQNILPIIQKMFKEDLGLIQEHLLAIFDGEYNELAP
mmetsp:Transcript_18955/g.32383  ORF Transcript_18955/g.32383 Transcript_18955/m.32383 type:complete len:152 (-) Transcript_18955:449-904(-)